MITSSPLRSSTIIAATLALGLMLGVALGSAPARAQLTVEPQEVSVAVEQGETATRTLALTNEGTEPLAFCLSFERPLQRAGGEVRLDAEALGGACGAYGEVLALVGDDGVPEPWNPYGLAMTADGRLFAADFSDGLTFEFDAALNYVRHFAHPEVGELAPFPKTRGVTYNADTGTLWWLNVEGFGFDVHRALLLEGDLDGVPTGRRIELPIGAPDVPPDERVRTVGLSYDPTRAWYYYTDTRGETIWAVDTLGNGVEGYPIEMEGYPGATLGRGLNAFLDPSASGEDDSGGAGLRLELYVNPPGPALPRLGVVGRYGGDTAPNAEPLETFYASYDSNAETGGVGGEAVRSVLDPSGVLYYPWSSFEDTGIVAIRPHPLPPSWLVVQAWGGSLAPGENQSIELTFRPGGRDVGAYAAVLQAFEAESGAVVEVPLSLTVTQGTDAEDGATTEVDAVSLAVYPNPSSGTATVALALPKAAEVRVVVFDVLGREVAALHGGPLAVGAHRFGLGARALPAGVYVVRVAAGEQQVAQKFVVTK